MTRNKTLPAVVITGIALQTPAVSLLQMPAAIAQELPMRQTQTWNGETDGGRPRQGYYPGIDQQVLLQHQQILQTWQDAERRSYETRVTPEHVLRDLQAKIQYCHNTGNYVGEANYWQNLAQTLQSAGMAVYTPPGLDAATCYKGEVTARLEHISQVQHRDPATELAEWEKVRPLASSFSEREPGDARWPYLVAMSYVKQGPGSFGAARQWLNRCSSVPGCPPELKEKCQSTMAEMTAEEARLRQEAEARAVRERQLAAEREKAADNERRKREQGTQHNGEKYTLEEAASAISQSKLINLIQAARQKERWNDALDYANQLTKIPDNRATRAKEGVGYLLRADVLYNLNRYQEALDDCNKGEQLMYLMSAQDQATTRAALQQIRGHIKEYTQRK